MHLRGILRNAGISLHTAGDSPVLSILVFLDDLYTIPPVRRAIDDFTQCFIQISGGLDGGKFVDIYFKK